jgi:hypothetical protein
MNTPLHCINSFSRKKMKPVSVNEAATFSLPTPSASNSTSPGSLLSGNVDASELDMVFLS